MRPEVNDVLFRHTARRCFCCGGRIVTAAGTPETDSALEAELRRSGTPVRKRKKQYASAETICNSGNFC